MNRWLPVYVAALVAVLISAWPTIATAIRTGGGFTQGLADTLYCQLTGCPMTGTTTYSGVTTDITAASAEDVRIQGGATSGSVVFRSIDNVTQVEDGSGNVDLSIQASASLSRGMINAGTGGAIEYGGSGIIAGAATGLSGTQAVFTVADGMSAINTNTPLQSVYGAGLIVNEAAAVQTCDCGTTGTPNTVSCNISSPFVLLTDSDADACTVSIDDAAAATIDKFIQHVTIVVDADGGGGTFDIAEVAGELQLSGGTTLNLGPGDMVACTYVAGSLDTWQCAARTDI